MLLIVQELKKDLLSIKAKLDKLLDSYLDNTISREDYLRHKENLFSDKKTLEEKISSLELFPNTWLEPMREFFNLAYSSSKIAGDEKNLIQKREFLIKTGSNLTLKDKTVDCDLPIQWAALRAAPTSRNKVDLRGFEPLTSSM